MKTKTKSPPVTKRTVSEDEIRDYAQHLYEQSGRLPGHDLDNWLEAKACLESNIPREHSHSRLHRHRHPPAPVMVEYMSTTTLATESAEDFAGPLAAEEIVFVQPSSNYID